MIYPAPVGNYDRRRSLEKFFGARLVAGTRRRTATSDAKDFTAPGSTAGIERAFNFCDISLFEKRQRTTDENSEQMILSR